MYRQMRHRRRHLMTVDQEEQGLRQAQLLRPTRERWARMRAPVQPVGRLPGRPKVVPLQAAAGAATGGAALIVQAVAEGASQAQQGISEMVETSAEGTEE